jgi:hypothetical protein
MDRFSRLQSRSLNGKPRNACLLRGRTGAESMITTFQTLELNPHCEVAWSPYGYLYKSEYIFKF